MKTLITLLTSTLMLANAASAQFSENFEQNTTNLPSSCWFLDGINYTTAAADVITGNGSGYTNPPTSSSGERAIYTPFLDVNSTSLTISFKYKVSSKISGNATRTIQIGLVDNNGVFTTFQTITMDKNTPTTVLTHTATYSVAVTGVYRVGLRIGGANGDGNSRVIFDDLSVNASVHYGAGSTCNPAATAVNDSYTTGTLAPISGDVKLNDVIPADGETYSAVLVTSPSTGTLVLNSDGTFTYTPSASFTGGTVTFSYQLVDNGYTPATSNTALVTLNLPSPATLPLELISFTAGIDGANVRISWKVDMNEDGDFFEIQKSFDGKNFTTIERVFAEVGSGVKNYQGFDNVAQSNVYYRLKLVNKDHSLSYSKVVLVKSEVADADLKVMNNPAISNLTFSYHGTQAITTIRMYSITGVKVYEQKLTSVSGINKTSISLNTIPAGTYVLQLDNGGAKYSTKFIKR